MRPDFYNEFKAAQQERERLLTILETISESSQDVITQTYARGVLDATRSLSPIPRDQKEAAYTPTQYVPVLHRLARSFLYMSKAKKRGLIALFVVMALATIGSIAAAIIIFSGSSGQVQGKIESGTTATALTVSAQGTVPTLVKGEVTPIPVLVHNNDANLAHTPTSWDVTFTTSPSECAQYLANSDGLPLTSIPAGADVLGSLAIGISVNMPGTCANADWTAHITGTTNP